MSPEAYAILGGTTALLGIVLGAVAFAWARFHWSRDEVILRARRREQRRRDRLRRLEEREVHYRNARGLPVGQWTVDNAPPIPVQPEPPSAPPR